METPSPSSNGLINFCLQPLVQLTSCSVSADNYQATNLVTTDPSLRSRGFRVEHFIRPPVHLDYEFQLPLNIACIIIRPDLPPSSEMKLELTGSFHTSSVTSDFLKICPYAVVTGNQPILILENKSFNMRGRERVSLSKTDILSWPVQGSFLGSLRSSCGEGKWQPVLQPLRHPNLLGKLRQLRVTVNRSTGPKPVAIRSLEVWGSPSNTCSALQLNLVQTSLAAVLERGSSSSGQGGVSMYRSVKSSPEQEAALFQEQLMSANDLHRSSLDKSLGGSYDWDTGTSCESRGEVRREACGGGDSDVSGVRLGGSELQVQEECKQERTSRGASSSMNTAFGVAGCGQYEMPEVLHIKAATSENKKPPKPQQRYAEPHLQGCRHNIQNGGKPALLGLNEMLPQGKNGNPFSCDGAPTDNSADVCDEENSPGSSCGLERRGLAASLARQQHCQQQQGEQKSSQRERGRQQCQRQTQCTFIEQEIPTEFLDKITYEVMHVPMLLPSGYCVDRSTLEKLSNSDALYGRPPTDPFTGIPFSESSKPSFFPELKLRLDQFLSSSSSAQTNLSARPLATAAGGGAQTLGSAREIAAHLQKVQEETERGGNGKRIRDNSDEAVLSKEPTRKKFRSTAVKETPRAHQSCASGPGSGPGPTWAGPFTQSPSYLQRSGHGSPVKDQSRGDRIRHHAGPQCSSLPANHSLQLQRDKSQFEQEVAGSLDDALKQLLSDT